MVTNDMIRAKMKDAGKTAVNAAATTATTVMLVFIVLMILVDTVFVLGLLLSLAGLMPRAAALLYIVLIIIDSLGIYLIISHKPKQS